MLGHHTSCFHLPLQRRNLKVILLNQLPSIGESQTLSPDNDGRNLPIVHRVFHKLVIRLNLEIGLSCRSLTGYCRDQHNFGSERNMDLGIRGKTAIVCASSKGLGRGCAEALAADGVSLVLSARSDGPLQETAAHIRKTYGVEVTAIACDITTEEGRAKVLAACPDPDILVNNAGGPPPGHWSDWDREDFIAALDANMLTPIALIKAVLPGMMARGWGRIVNITSQSVKAPIPILGLSNAARTGLTGYVAGTARQVAASGVTINNLLPGSHDTDRRRGLDTSIAQSSGQAVADVTKDVQSEIPARRYGTAEEFGATCAFMCSQHAGFMVGQNVLLDGGQVNSTL